VFRVAVFGQILYQNASRHPIMANTNRYCAHIRILSWLINTWLMGLLILPFYSTDPIAIIRSHIRANTCLLLACRALLLLTIFADLLDNLIKGPSPRPYIHNHARNYFLMRPIIHACYSPSSSTSSTISLRAFSETLRPIIRKMVDTVSTVMQPDFSVSKESKAFLSAVRWALHSMSTTLSL
jgi:hypothetical protein